MNSQRLEALKRDVKHRHDEIELLNSFVTADSGLLAPSLVVSGYKSVGKTYTVQRFLEEAGIKHTVVRCDECISQKLLLQRCLKRIKQESGVDLSSYQQQFNYKGQEVTREDLLCENFASFVVALEQFVREANYTDNHVLVLDKFEQCIDSTNNLFPSFLKVYEYSSIKNIPVLFIVSHEDPKEILTASAPHIFFSPYSQEQVIDILQSNQLCFFGRADLDNNIGYEFWKQYSKVIVDLFFAYTGPDMTFLIDICYKLWPEFTEPVLNGTYRPHDFLKIYRDKRHLFNNDNVINNSSVQEYNTGIEEQETDSMSIRDLPHHSKFILIASYLASFVDTKNDLHYFSKLKSVKNHARKLKGKKAASKQIDNRLLSPNYFDLERLRAILSVIYRNESESLTKSNTEFFHLYQDSSESELTRKENEHARFTPNAQIDVNSQIVTLESLGLITRTYALDVLSSKVRWKCNINWSTVEAVTKEINFPLSNYLAE